jgi:hypothetical protein
MARFGRSPFVLSAGLALLLTSCDRISEIRQCRALAREISQALDGVEALSTSTDPERTSRMAGAYDALAKTLSPRAEGGTPLAAAVRDYTSLIETTAHTLKAHADAVRAGQAARIAETRRDLERIVKRERAAIARLSAECHA